MATDPASSVKFEIGHVLFIDLVGYSKLLIDGQTEQLEILRQVVRGTEEVRTAEAAGKLLRLPTGDGGALVFRTNTEAPAECAIEISRRLKEYPQLRVRMGIHSGPVNSITDLNEQANIAGAGINYAQRVMDCGDAGHILVSRHVAEDLEQYPRWRSCLHDLGRLEVKHGVRLGLANLYDTDFGNPEIPKKLQAVRRRSHAGRAAAALGLFAVIAIVALGLLFFSRRQQSIGTAPEKSIAVLPFDNLSDDKQNAFFTDGVQDEILTDLSKIGDLKVISRTSVMPYRNAAARNLKEIAQTLGVAHVLEGSVQRAANKVRVNAQLIDARNDAHLWAQSYDRDLADVFAIQSEIATAIAEQLAVHLSSREKAELAQPPTTDLLAYDLYRRARELDDTADDPNAKGNLLQAISLLEEAVRRDPKFLRAYCLMCETHLDLYWGGADHSNARRDLARVTLEKAEAINPDAAEVHWQKGVYAYHGFRDYDGALAELELARRLLPNEPRIYLTMGAIDRRTARWPEAETNFTRAAELDPNNYLGLLEAGSIFGGLRRVPEAQHFLQRALKIKPNDVVATNFYGFNFFTTTGDATGWRKELEDVAAKGPEEARAAAFPLLYSSWIERNRAAAEKALSLIPPEGITNTFDETAVPREYCAARTAWLFGDREAAQGSLNAARAIFQRMTTEQPDYPQGWSYLGLTDAMLGRCDEATEEGKRACDLLPLSKDSWTGTAWVTNLATIYTYCDRKDLALEQLAISAKVPAGITYGELKQSPDWDSLRGDPRFEEIVASLTPK